MWYQQPLSYFSCTCTMAFSKVEPAWTVLKVFCFLYSLLLSYQFLHSWLEGSSLHKRTMKIKLVIQNPNGSSKNLFKTLERMKAMCSTWSQKIRYNHIAMYLTLWYYNIINLVLYAIYTLYTQLCCWFHCHIDFIGSNITSHTMTVERHSLTCT